MQKGIFKGSEKQRQAALSNFYERNLDDLFGIPQIGLNGINNILSQVFSSETLPRFNMVLLKINYLFELSPTPKNCQGNLTNWYEYSFRFFHVLYRVCYRHDKKSLFINLDFNVQKIIVSWLDDFWERRKIFTLDDLLYCADLNANRFNKATGIAVKKTSKRGVFKIGSRQINLSAKHKNEFVLVFFVKGEIIIFDFNGQRILPITIGLA